MIGLIRKHSEAVCRFGLALATFLIALLTGGDTARIAPFAVAFVLALSLGLLTVRHTRYLTLPFLMLTLLLIFCYDSYAVFIRYVWLLPIVLVALVVHIIRLRPHLFVGVTLPPLVAVAAATLLGGIGMITTGEYFRGAAIAFVIGLGPGLVFTYWILKNALQSEEDERWLADDMTAWGLCAAAIVLAYTVPRLFSPDGLFGAPELQWSNNISTMLMLAMPALLARRERRIWQYGGAFLIFAATFLAGSRGGILFVGIELVLCMLWAWRTEEEPLRRIWARLFFWYALMGVGYFYYLLICNYRIVLGGIEQEARFALFERSLENFKQNPLFGCGIGYLGNADLYSGKVGTVNWFHMLLPQIWGSMGICGVLAWGWQLLTRARLALRLHKTPAFGLALSYVGLLLMSLVNPGEFCPAPYAFLAVYIFVLLENRAKDMPLFPLFSHVKRKKQQPEDSPPPPINEKTDFPT